MNTTTLLMAIGVFLPGADKPAELKEIAVWKLPGKSTTIFQFSPDGRILVTGSAGEPPEVILWDPRSGRKKTALAGHLEREFDQVAFSADGRLVAAASGNSNGQVKVWETATGKELHSFPGGQSQGVYALRFSADARSLFAAGTTAVYSWELKDGKRKALFERRVMGGGIFSADCKTFASTNYEDLDLWDVRSGKIRRILPDHHGGVVGVVFSADGKTVAAAVQRNDGKKDHWQVQLWDAENGKELRTVSCDQGFLHQILLDDKAQMLVVLHSINWHDPDAPTELRFYDLSSGRECVSRKNVSDRSRVALSPDGKLLATLEPDNQIKVWELPPTTTEKAP